MRQRGEHLSSHIPTLQKSSGVWKAECAAGATTAFPCWEKQTPLWGEGELIVCEEEKPWWLWVDVTAPLCIPVKAPVVCFDCAFLFQTKDINSFGFQSFALLCEQINCTTLSTLKIHRICEGIGLRHACHYSLHIYTSSLSLVAAAGCTQVNSIT